MATYRTHIAALAPLRSFEASVFVADYAHNQEFCDFVLALALVYNDLRDIFTMQVFLQDVAPSDTDNPTPELGEFGGIHVHLTRMLAGLLRELVVLIEDNKAVVASVAFDKLVQKLQPRARAAWKNVIAVTGHKPAQNSLTKLLVFARNNVSFHYSAKALGKGFGVAFVEDPTRVPYVSPGGQMATTRFFFADAAAESYIRTIGAAETAHELFTAATPILGDLNRALHDLVLHFTKVRGGMHALGSSA